MREIALKADDLLNALLGISQTKNVCFLDSCGVSHLNSHLLVAGVQPIEISELESIDPNQTLEIFNKLLANRRTATIFTISYDLGLKLQKITRRKKECPSIKEPDIFFASFKSLVVHDYKTGQTFLDGDSDQFDQLEQLLLEKTYSFGLNDPSRSEVSSNFTESEYIRRVEKIQEYIRDGDTYQTNLTQQFRAELPKNLSSQELYLNLRSTHPAPFSAFLKRKDDFVVSISPERFVSVDGDRPNETDGVISGTKSMHAIRRISASPIKGTRPRGDTEKEDSRLRNELIHSAKDRAENTMIVDLLRNDIGRICEFGSVEVEKLCDLEKHPTLFHLVSTVVGKLRNDVDFADLLRAIFPCGSITGCPKIRTMQIIDELETTNRGLSMGAIGYCGFDNTLDLSVAIRTMVIRGQVATFNVGGGIVIDSNPKDEYRESLLKAKAILASLNAT